MRQEVTMKFKDLVGEAAPQTHRLDEVQRLREQVERLEAAQLAQRQEIEALRGSFRLISHDLRAPVRALSQLSEWIYEDGLTRHGGELARNLKLLRARALRLEQMHRDLSGYARCVELLEQEAQSYQLGELIALCWQGCRERRASGVFEFALEVDPELELITGRREVMQAMISRLLDNALHHHDRDEGLVSVSARGDSGCVLVQIEDDGPGIAPHLHDKALKPMQTLRARDRGAGTGLGLSYVDKMVRAMGGRLHLEDAFVTTSRGLRVTLELARDAL